MNRPHTRQRGETHSSAKLTGERAREIYAAYHAACPCCGRGQSLHNIAARYNVSNVTVHKIVTGKAWVHATGHRAQVAA